MIYRPLGLLVWRTAQFAGYDESSLTLLQAFNALAGAIGVGLAYVAFKRTAGNRAAALIGAVFIATSFTFWVCATDVFYLTLAGMFAAGAIACVVYASSTRWIVTAAILTALSICTWQASIFLIPALLLLLPRNLRTLPAAATLAGTSVLLAGITYTVVAFTSRGLTTPRELWTWFTTYGETATLAIWGVWESTRIPVAAVTALDSILAVRLAATPYEWLHPVQLGRIAVDLALLAFVMLLLLAAIRLSPGGLRFLAGYGCFLPFIVWWDPGSHKWFLIPNLFLAGFLACSLVPWFQDKWARRAIISALLVIAGTNFVTTIRPRHFIIGMDRSMAECVAGHMDPSDLFVAAEWGWPDYLQYLHGRSAVNLINQSALFSDAALTLNSVRETIATTLDGGGKVYMADPRNYSETHIRWLESTAGLDSQNLASLGGSSSFVCYGRSINLLTDDLQPR
jgi:hypothetical protein